MKADDMFRQTGPFPCDLGNRVPIEEIEKRAKEQAASARTARVSELHGELCKFRPELKGRTYDIEDGIMILWEWAEKIVDYQIKKEGGDGTE